EQMPQFIARCTAVRDAEAGGHAWDGAFPAFARSRNAGDGETDLLGTLARFRQCAARQDETELLAAEAAEEIDSTQVHLARGHGLLEDGVARGMTEPVVDLLEVIEVAEDDADFLARPAALLQHDFG